MTESQGNADGVVSSLRFLKICAHTHVSGQHRTDQQNFSCIVSLLLRPVFDGANQRPRPAKNNGWDVTQISEC